MGIIAAGKDIDHYCTRCKLELAHTIIAVVSGVPARVKCNTCHTERKFRGARKAKSTARSGPVRRSTTTKPAPSSGRSTTQARKAATEYEKLQKWNALMDKAAKAGIDAKPYSMRETLEPGVLVMHSKFGIGYAQELVPPNKVLICFKGGDRLLIHGRQR